MSQQYRKMLPADGTTMAGLVRRVCATHDPSRADLRVSADGLGPRRRGAEIWLAPQICPRARFSDELGEPVAIITVKVVQASPLPVVRAPFLYSSGSVDNSYTPLLLSNQRQVDSSVRRKRRA